MTRMQIVATLLFIFVICLMNVSATGGFEECPKKTYLDKNGVPRWECTSKMIRMEPFNRRMSPVIFSHDLTRVAYSSGSTAEAIPSKVVVNGQISTEYDQVGFYLFSPDSSRFAFSAKKGEQEFLVLDGKNETFYAYLGSRAVFSPDSKHIVYTASSGGKDVVILDNGLVGSHEFVHDDTLVFSSDSKHFAYCAEDDDTATLYVDGKKDCSFQEIISHSVRFSPDSKQVVYACRNADGYFVVFGDKKIGPFNEVNAAYLTVSGNGKRFAFPARRGERWCLVTEAREFASYVSHPIPLFSPDSKGLAHCGKLTGNDEYTVFLNGKELERGGKCAFSHDSKQFIYVAKDKEREFLVVDGKRICETEEILTTQYSRDSSRLAVVCREGDKQCVVEDSKQGQWYARIESLCFSADSKHLAYWAISGDEYVLVIDGLETLRGELAFGRPKLTDFGINGFRSGAVVTVDLQASTDTEKQDIEKHENRESRIRLALFELREITNEK